MNCRLEIGRLLKFQAFRMVLLIGFGLNFVWILFCDFVAFDFDWLVVFGWLALVFRDLIWLVGGLILVSMLFAGS